MKLKILYSAFLVLICNVGLNAQLLQWNTFGNTGSETTEPSVFNNANIAASSLTLGAGVLPAANANRLGGSNWFDTGDTNPTTLAESVSGNDYIQFIVTPNSGVGFTATSLVFGWDRSGTGPPNVTLRSSLDGFAADLGSVTGMAASQTNGNTITISGLLNITSAVTFRLYGFGATATGGTGGFDVASNAVNVQLNGTATVFKTSNGTGGGDWNTAATWSPAGVPLTTESVIILASDNVYTTTALTRSAATNVNGVFQLNSGGYASGTNFTYGATGSLNFNTASGYNVNTESFWPVAGGPFNVNVLQAGITLNVSRTVNGVFSTGAGGIFGVNITSPAVLTINGTCRIDTGGFFNDMPVYGAASTLLYNAGSVYGRSKEWDAPGVGTIASTPGYPNNVRVSNNTTLDYPRGGTPGIKGMAGNLIIDAGSSLYMDYGGFNDNGALTVAGSVNVAGNLSLGQAPGDDLIVGGNLLFTGAGTFFGNNRAVYFSGNSLQVISSVMPLTIPYVVLSGTTTTVQLLSDLTISAPSVGNVINFLNPAGIVDINGRTLTLGSAGFASVIAGSGSFKGSASSNLTLLGNSSIGTLNFTSGFQNLGTLTINRPGTPNGCILGTPLTVNTSLGLTGGHLDVGNNPLTIGSSATISSSASNYVIADFASGSSASLRKIFTAAGSFIFPVGDKTGTAEYSPVTIALAGGSYAAGAYAGVAVNDIKHPSFDASSDYITRYWDVASSGITSPSSFTATGTYPDADVNTPAAEATYLGNKWDGTAWSNPVTIVNAGANSTNAIACIAGGTNQITAGKRDQDINVVQGAATYLTGTTYDFGTVLTGSSTPAIFTIQNIGQLNLTLSPAAAFTGNPDYFYTTPYTGGIVTGPTGTQNFTITFTPSGPGTFTGSISIPNNDSIGSENPYIINFTGIAVNPSPEINVKGYTGSTGNIADGSVTASGLNNTLFAATNIGSSAIKDFEIQNTSSGTAVLVLSGVPSVAIGGANPGDFAVTAFPTSTSIAVNSSTTFVITFSPLASGVRTAIVTISNNDFNEAPYDFLIQGTGVCPAATNTITPLSGPVNTEVTITASAGNLTGATITFNGIAAVITPVSSTQITVIVPAGATTGNLTTTNFQGCKATNYFNVIDKTISSCQGSGTPRTRLFISEITDHPSGSHSYIEIFNATGGTVNLLNYTLRIHNNGAATPTSTITLPSYNLANNTTYVVGFGGVDATSNPGGYSPNLTSTVSGVNNDDNIRLYDNTGTWIDLWGDTTGAAFTVAPAGYYYRRKNVGIIAPSTTWNANDWTSSSPVNYSDIGLYDFSVGTPPTITLHPTYIPSCKAASLTVAATEGFTGSNPLAYQWFIVAPLTTTWTAVANGGIYSGATTPTLTISDVSGLANYQFYCQVRENTATCYAASNAVKITLSPTVTWNGTAWSPASPTISSKAVINGNYNTLTNGSFEACSVTVNAGFNLTVGASNYVSIQNDLTVSSTATLQVLDKGSLVMIDDAGIVTNNGTTQIKRSTSPYEKFDYTYWSTPVSAANIGTTFPGWRTDKSYTFITANFADLDNDTFDDAAPYAWTFAGPAANMSSGTGYAIMGNTSLGSYPATDTITFSGAVNNGIITTPITLSGNGASATDDYNLIGNPYPSAISATAFINSNPNISGTLYFWTHIGDISASNPGPNAQDFISDDYALFNLTGGTRASFTGSAVPDGFIGSGQGFFIEAVTAGNITFNNAMRNKAYSNSQFFRNSNQETERDRVWLNLRNADGMFCQQLIGYFNEATHEYDRGYDGQVYGINNFVSFYSFIDSARYRIQGRSAFDIDDVVELGYTSAVEGEFNISIDDAEGIFNNGITHIFLRDKYLNIVHDLSQAQYVFMTDAGTFNERFELLYTLNSLSEQEVLARSNQVVVATGKSLKVRSTGKMIQSVIVYDITGRIIFEGENYNQKEIVLNTITLQSRPLIIRTILSDGSTSIIKTVY